MAAIEAVETVYLEANQTSVTFSSIGSFEHYQIHCQVRNTFAYPQGGGRLTFNSIAGTAYSRSSLRGFTSSKEADGGTGEANARIPTYLTGNGVGGTSGPEPIVLDYSPFIVDIFDAHNTSKNTSMIAPFGCAVTLTGTTFMGFGSATCDDTADITSITLSSDGNWKRGSVFTLYGLRSS